MMTSNDVDTPVILTGEDTGAEVAPNAWTLAALRGDMLACCNPQNSAHRPMNVPVSFGVNRRWLGWPGMASCFPASSGTQKLWMTLSDVSRMSTG